MYEQFFGLSKKPFELVPNPDFLYLGGTHKKALTYLNYAVSEKTGFVMLTGEVGSGKTTLIRNFINRLDHQVTLAKVFNTKVSFEQLIAMINDDFGLDGTGKDKVTLLKELYHFLVEEHAKGHSPILIIDEAQNFSPAVLEEVRMLSNLETGDAKLLQIILVGQPELAAMLSLAELRQLRQRISIVCHVYPLTRQECEEYIFHRLSVAGNRQAVQFSPEALDGIYNYSNGIPRLVNIVCNFLLLTAFTEDTRTVNQEMVSDIVKELQTEVRIENSDSSSAGKRALLNALGSPSTGGDGTMVAQASDQANGEGKVRLLLKDMGLRIAALEKEHVRIRAQDLDDIERRLKYLEKSRPTAVDANQGSRAPSVPLKTTNTSAPPAPAAVRNDNKKTSSKKGLFKRLVGAE